MSKPSTSATPSPSLLSYILTNEESFRRARLPSLYSDFRPQATTNPDGYAANVSAWQLALTHACRAGFIPAQHSQNKGFGSDILVLRTGEDLIRALESEAWGRPLGLGCVIDDAVHKSAFIPLRDYLAATHSIYRKSWAISPRQVLNWAFRQIGLGAGRNSYDEDAKLKVGQLVIVANLEEAAKKVLERVEASSTSTVERIYSREMFSQEFTLVLETESKTGLSETDLGVLLRYLERDKGAIAHDGRTIKFRSPSASTPESITQEDATIASLRTLIINLTTQCTSLTTRMSTLDTAARTSLAAKNRISALSAIRSRKAAEATLKQRADTLQQLETVYAQIEAATDQVEIVRIMEASTSVLKGLNEQIGGVERVEDVLENLREEMGKVDEVGKILQEGAVEGQVVDEGEVDDELEAMEREQKAKEEEMEAESTRKRLEEVEKVPGEKKPEEDVGLEESMKRLSQMSIDEKPGMQNTMEQSESDQRRTAALVED